VAKREKITIEEKIWLVEECLAGRMRGREAARRAGVGATTMQRWISHYKADGAAGLRDGNKTPQSYSEAVKQKAVSDYLDGKGSLLTIARRYHIHADNLVRRWVKEYHCHREITQKLGGKAMAKNKYTLEDRLHAVREHLEHGKSISDIAAEYRVNENSVRKWVKKYQAMGIAGLEDRRGQRTGQQTPRTLEEELRVKNAQLEHEIYLLRMENDLLKKLKELERGKD
jgi:transposase-like protein